MVVYTHMHMRAYVHRHTESPLLFFMNLAKAAVPHEYKTSVPFPLVPCYVTFLALLYLCLDHISGTKNTSFIHFCDVFWGLETLSLSKRACYIFVFYGGSLAVRSFRSKELEGQTIDHL